MTELRGTGPLDGPYYLGQAKVVNVRPETFSVEPEGPEIDEGTYVGRSQAVLQDDRSPDQFHLETITGPFALEDALYYNGRSQAIHVWGEDLEVFPPVTPIDGCKCCEEQGVGGAAGPLGGCYFEDWSDPLYEIPASVPGSLGGDSATDWIMNVGGPSDIAIAGNALIQHSMSPQQHSFTQTINAATAPTQFATLKAQQDFVFRFSMTEPAAEQNSQVSVQFAISWLGSPSGSVLCQVGVSYDSIAGHYNSGILMQSDLVDFTASTTGNIFADGEVHEVHLTIGGFFRYLEVDSLNVLDSSKPGYPFNATTRVETFLLMDNASGFNFGASSNEETLMIGGIELPDSDSCVDPIDPVEGGTTVALGDCADVCDGECTSEVCGITDTMDRANRTVGSGGLGRSSSGVLWRNGSGVGEPNTQSLQNSGITGNEAVFRTFNASIGIQATVRQILPIEELNLPDGVGRKLLTGTVRFNCTADASDLTGNQTLYPVLVQMNGGTGAANGGMIRVRQAGPTASNPGTRMSFATGTTSTTENFACIAIIKNTWYTLRFSIEEGQVMRAKVWADGDPEPGSWIDSTIVSSALARFDGIQIGNSTSKTGLTIDTLMEDLDVDGGSACDQFFFDNFNRTTTSGRGWETADSGWKWHNLSATVASPSVSSTTGAQLSASNADQLDLVAVPAAVSEAPWMDVGGFEFLTRFRPSAVSSSAGERIETEILVEEPGGDQASLRIRVGNGSGSTGEIQLACTGFTTSALARTTWAVVDYFVRWEFRPGSVNRVRVWPVTSAEPGTWDLDQAVSGSPADPTAMTRFAMRAAKTAGLGSGLTFQFRFIDFTDDDNCLRIDGGGFNCPNSNFGLGTAGSGLNTANVASVDIGPFAALPGSDYWVLMLSTWRTSATATLTGAGAGAWTAHPGNGQVVGSGKNYIWWALAPGVIPVVTVAFSPNSSYEYFVTVARNVDQIYTDSGSGGGTGISFGTFGDIANHHIAIRSQGLWQAPFGATVASPLANGGISHLHLDPVEPIGRLFGQLQHDYPYEDATAHSVAGTGSVGVAWGGLSVAFYQERDCDGWLIGGGDGGGGCGDCEECEDPDNPGFQIPDFTPGYMPIFRPQIGDPTTSLDAFICTMEAGAMVLDWHTRGAIQVWGGELIPWTGRSESSIFGSGTNLSDLSRAWSHYGQVLGMWSGGTWNDVMRALSEGRAVVLQGDYDQFNLAERCQDSLVSNHAIALFPYQVADRLLVGDPVCHDFKAFKISSLQAYAEDLGVAVFGVTSPQKILFAVSRPWVP